MTRTRPSRPALATVVFALMLVLSGCGIRIPADPDGTLERISGGDLRVGASPAAGLVSVNGDEVSGSMAVAVNGFAASREAHVVWTVGSEEELVDGLENGRLDLAIGGMTEQTPWSERVSVTRSYPALSPDGREIVFLLPMGENALQSALEGYLDDKAGK
ncbi:hypothetical protein [uncultured Microbacterium sp.]|uniref:hypothetical protein n=1 Tax=uncultured Microbacterium sp. TaxID=191216 RepID=UPI0025F0ADBD|nr:hypothetical protein [uncultured Microbacterium sp.]